jgi:hypothetical protein
MRFIEESPLSAPLFYRVRPVCLRGNKLLRQGRLERYSVRSLAPLEKTRGFGMTPSGRVRDDALRKGFGMTPSGRLAR